jgi:hypothetical protein
MMEDAMSSMRAAALIGLSLAVSGVSAANAATISEIDAFSLSADPINPDFFFAIRSIIKFKAHEVLKSVARPYLVLREKWRGRKA